MDVDRVRSSKQGSQGKCGKVVRNEKAQTIVKMSGNKGQTREVYQPVTSKEEIKSRSEPQKKPQVGTIAHLLTLIGPGLFLRTRSRGGGGGGGFQPPKCKK